MAASTEQHGRMAEKIIMCACKSCNVSIVLEMPELLCWLAGVFSWQSQDSFWLAQFVFFSLAGVSFGWLHVLLIGWSFVLCLVECYSG